MNQTKNKTKGNKQSILGSHFLFGKDLKSLLKKTLGQFELKIKISIIPFPLDADSSKATLTISQ